MTRPEYSVELREQVLQAADAGRSGAEIARSFGLSRRSLTRWRQWRRDRGTVATKPRSGRPPKIAPGQYAALRAQIAADPDATLDEHCTRWEQTHGTSISPDDAGERLLLLSREARRIKRIGAEVHLVAVVVAIAVTIRVIRIRAH